MKLKRLVIHNIASIEDAEIDFSASPLADTDIFLISGETGAGKSTILDCICLALYNTAPRIADTAMEGKAGEVKGEISLNDPRNLLRRNTGEGAVRLTFTGNDGVEYLAEWSVARARGKANGKLQARQWTLTDLDAGVTCRLEKEVTAMRDRAVGLSFGQFCRTTMLAQGEFTRFLNSRDNDKAAILEKITGVSVYGEIGRGIYERTEGLRLRCEEIKSRMADVRLLSEEETARIRESITAARTKEKEAASARDAAAVRRQWLEGERILGVRKLAALEALEAARKLSEAPEAVKMRRDVKDWKETVQERRLLADLAGAERDERDAAGKLAALRGRFGAIRLSSGQLAGRAAELAEKEAALKSALETARAGMERFAAAQSDLTETTDGADEMRPLTLARLRERHERNGRWLETAAAASAGYGTLEEIERQRKETSERMGEYARSIEALQTRYEAAESALRGAGALRDSANETYERQLDTVGKWAREARGKLRHGDVCPVCGQTVESPLPSEKALDEVVGVAREAYEKAKTSFEAAEREKHKAEAELGGARRHLTELEHLLKASSERMEQALERQRGYLRQLGMDENAGKDALDGATASRRESDEALAAVISEWERLEKRVTAAQGEHERTALLAEQAAAKASAVGVAVERIVKAVPEWEDEAGEASPVSPAGPVTEAEASETATKVEMVLTAYEEAEKRRADIKKELDGFYAANGRYASPEGEEGLTRLEWLARRNDADIRGMEERLRRLDDNLLEKRSAAEGIRRQVAEHELTRPQIAEGETEVSLREVEKEADAAVRAHVADASRFEAALAADAENRLRWGDMERQAREAREEYERWGRLCRLFGDASGNKFRRIAQSYILGSLVEAANRYMEMLTPRYRLAVRPGTFVVLVEDAYQGFVSRPAHTVSGGESFLVSLALALALSDIGSTLSVDILFIDEGFGTLSGDPLRAAVSTLRSLRRHAGRRVGVISHVEELREKVPVQIRVSRDPRLSSATVEVSDGVSL